MSKSPLSVRYHLELYTTSFGNDPFYAVELSSPLSGLNVGDEFETRGMDSFPLTVGQGSVGVVAKVQHILWEIEDSHFSHKIMLLIDIKSADDL